MQGGWIGVDLDGTLAMYEGWQGHQHIGEPVPLMLERVKEWLANGREVRIFTARVWHPHRTSSTDLKQHEARLNEAAEARVAIELWCERHLGVKLAVTCEKDYAMVELWDDRAVQVIPNTGQRADQHSGQAGAATARG